MLAIKDNLLDFLEEKKKMIKLLNDEEFLSLSDEHKKELLLKLKK